MEVDSIIISTVDRQPEYIHKTLASLGLTLDKKKDIHLVVDGSSYSHYKTYGPYCKIYLNEVDSKADNNRKRATVNYVRCLMLSRSLGGLNLILEDDVLFHVDWVDKLKKINLNDESWILSLNSLSKQVTDDGYIRFLLPTRSPQPVWCGTYAVIYNSKVLDFLPESVIKTSFESNVFPYDICVGGVLHRNNVSIYEMAPAIVKHIGEKSLMEDGLIREVN